MRCVLATRNAGKVRELRALFAGVADFEIVSLEDVGPVPDVVEDGETFAANAEKKARAVAHATGLIALADDSGLEVDALGGAPGVRSARYAGEGASDEANWRKLVAALTNANDAARGAQFRAVLVLAAPDPGSPTVAGPEFVRVVHVTEGILRGRIAHRPAGTGGFGYDPVFVPEGDPRALAEFAADEKNAISHRGRAARQMAAWLRENAALALGKAP